MILNNQCPDYSPPVGELPRLVFTVGFVASLEDKSTGSRVVNWHLAGTSAHAVIGWHQCMPLLAGTSACRYWLAPVHAVIGWHQCMPLLAGTSACRYWLAPVHAVIGWHQCMPLLAGTSACRYWLAPVHAVIGWHQCMPLLAGTSACRYWLAPVHAVIGWHQCMPLLAGTSACRYWLAPVHAATFVCDMSQLIPLLVQAAWLIRASNSVSWSKTAHIDMISWSTYETSKF